MIDRIATIRKVLTEAQADAAVISHLPNIRWASGFSGSNGLLVVTRRRAVLITDPRYREQAKQEVAGAEVVVTSEKPARCLVESDVVPAGTVLFQADYLPAAEATMLATALPEREWVAVTRLLDEFVASKSSPEVAVISRAQEITETVFAEIIALLKSGVTEREVAAEIVYRQLKHGASAMSFDPIVASGPHGALPHAAPTDRPIARGEAVVLDFGCVADGYCPDMTRTVFLGEPPAKAHAAYAAVLEAQAAAIDAARSGMTGQALDKVARDIITTAGYGEYFGHGLGHGVGLEIHEYPRVSASNPKSLPDGAVVTIEPGIYLPGEFGVRIEDMIQLHPGGCTNLTGVSKELLVLYE